MITMNSDELYQQLKKFSESFRTKLEKGTEVFAYKTADILIQSTPYGDSKTFEGLYKKREKQYGFKPIEGLSKGSWLMSFNDPVFINEIAYDNSSGGKSQARNHAIAQEYQLGETIYITNAVPYIEKLEKGSSKQAPEGIMELSLGKLQRLYGLNIAKILTGG
jgi:hypothetical protein